MTSEFKITTWAGLLGAIVIVAGIFAAMAWLVMLTLGFVHAQILPEVIPADFWQSLIATGLICVLKVSFAKAS